MPYYNQDNLTPEEEAMLMRLRPPGETVSPQPTPPPFGETVSPAMLPFGETVSPSGIDPRVQAYLKRTPDYKALAQIQSGALQGMAGGFAQMGTVHGKTPDASPFQNASQKMAQGIGMMEKPPIDPRVVQYLQKQQQPKSAPWKAVGKTPEGKIIYSDGTKEWVGENRSYIPKPQQKMPSKEPQSKPTAFQTEVDKNAGKQFGDIQSTIQGNHDSIQKLETIIAQLEQSPERTVKSRVLSGVLGDSKLKGVLQPEQARLQKELGDEILKMGERMKGVLSETDMAFLKGIVFDPTLSNQDNLATLKPMLAKVKYAQSELMARQKQLSTQGTLRGYQPPPLPGQGTRQLTPQEQEELRYLESLEQQGK